MKKRQFPSLSKSEHLLLLLLLLLFLLLLFLFAASSGQSIWARGLNRFVLWKYAGWKPRHPKFDCDFPNTIWLPNSSLGLPALPWQNGGILDCDLDHVYWVFYMQKNAERPSNRTGAGTAGTVFFRRNRNRAVLSYGAEVKYRDNPFPRNRPNRKPELHKPFRTRATLDMCVLSYAQTSDENRAKSARMQPAIVSSRPKPNNAKDFAKSWFCRPPFFFLPTQDRAEWELICHVQARWRHLCCACLSVCSGMSCWFMHAGFWKHIPAS